MLRPSDASRSPVQRCNGSTRSDPVNARPIQKLIT